MLILGTIGMAITAVAVWSTIHGQNGFIEVTKMLKGEPAFIVIDSARPSGSGERSSGGGERTGKPDDDKDDAKEQRTASDDIRDRAI